MKTKSCNVNYENMILINLHKIIFLDTTNLYTDLMGTQVVYFFPRNPNANYYLPILTKTLCIIQIKLSFVKRVVVNVGKWQTINPRRQESSSVVVRSIN